MLLSVVVCFLVSPPGFLQSRDFHTVWLQDCQSPWLEWWSRPGDTVLEVLAAYRMFYLKWPSICFVVYAATYLFLVRRDLFWFLILLYIGLTRIIYTTGRIRTFNIITTALLSEMSLSWVRASCEICLVSCGFKHASQSLSDTPLVRAYKHNLKTTGWYGPWACRMTALLSKTFLGWFRVAWEIRLESYCPRHAFTTILQFVKA